MSRARLRSQQGFTLIELLVVVLIIGILAAIAIPSFIGQKAKAVDAAAKSQVRTAQIATETYATDHSGNYKGVSVPELQRVEPTLTDVGTSELSIAKATEGGAGYEIESKSVTTGDTYKIERKASGEVARRCTKAGVGGCPVSETW